MNILKEPDELIGKPYDTDNYHCWHFIEECLDVPRLQHLSVDRAEENINDNMPFFIERETPLNYCLVLLGTKHIGLYKDGYIYHNAIDAVKCQSVRTLKRVYHSIKYYDKA